MVFQSYALYPHKTVYENIAFGLRIGGSRRRRSTAGCRSGEETRDCEPAQAATESAVWAGASAGVASAVHGRQRGVPDDEPLSNLDAALRISMRAEIKASARGDGTTFVYVTHDQAEALTLRRIVVMRDGLIQQVGTPTRSTNTQATCSLRRFLAVRRSITSKARSRTERAPRFFRRGSLRIGLPAGKLRTYPRRRGARHPAGGCDADCPAGGPELTGVVDSVLPVVRTASLS